MKLPTLALAGAATVVAATLLSGCPAAEPPQHVHGQLHVTLLHTSDLHSRLFPYDMLVGQADDALGLGASGTTSNVGGVARVSHILGRERAKASRVAHIDGGDCFQGAPVFNFFSGEAEVRAMSQLGTDAMVIANHEFDRGALNAANQLQRWATFPVLAANYLLEPSSTPGSAELGRVLSPFTVLDMEGLRVLVLGMGNLSSITSLYQQPNSLGITPLNTVDVAQFYVDLMRPLVDLVVVVTHLGLENDQTMIQHTSGIDVVLGGHNHIVLQPPQTVSDCACVDEAGQHYVEVPRADGIDPTATSPGPDPCNKGPEYVHRACTPRPVVLAHSGAFAKYVGRLDLVVSDRASDLPSAHEAADGFEVVSHSYELFPVTPDVPEDPLMVTTLEPYKVGLAQLADLDLLVGYAPDGSKRSATSGGDSPLGNLVATAMWLRLGVQTDFSLTNSTGIRTDMVPGPVTLEQMFNIFPFDNSITKMQLSGVEVRQLFDYVARRSAGRGCVSQAQIAGARVVLDCTGCDVPCAGSGDCPTGSTCTAGKCDPAPACARQIYMGGTSLRCASDADCPHPCDTAHGTCVVDPSVACKADGDCPVALAACNLSRVDAAGKGSCGRPVDPIGSYDLATSNYLALGGSGYRVLQRNTTQLDTKIQQRDALTDYVRQGHPCGWNAAYGDTGGLLPCSVDADCHDSAYVCACTGTTTENATTGTCTTSWSCSLDEGRCVLAACRDDVAHLRRQRCEESPDVESRERCRTNVAACDIGGEECKFLACVDRGIGNYADGRLVMVGH